MARIAGVCASAEDDSTRRHPKTLQNLHGYASGPKIFIIYRPCRLLFTFVVSNLNITEGGLPRLRQWNRLIVPDRLGIG
jgi:hypothetical protein